jgi:hypothetical protein
MDTQQVLASAARQKLAKEALERFDAIFCDVGTVTPTLKVLEPAEYRSYTDSPPNMPRSVVPIRRFNSAPNLAYPVSNSDFEVNIFTIAALRQSLEEVAKNGQKFMPPQAVDWMESILTNINDHRDKVNTLYIDSDLAQKIEVSLLNMYFEFSKLGLKIMPIIETTIDHGPTRPGPWQQGLK